MAAELLEHDESARELFQRAGEVLGLDLAGVCTKGDDALLTRTDIAQPALLTTCIAWFAVLQQRGLEAAVAAGHSLGEFTAWVAAGALEFEAALRLVRRRGELMEEAAERNPGGMVAVMGLRDRDVIDLCEKARRAGTVVPANFNSPGQVVVSGEPPALEEVADSAKAAGGKTVRLRVSGAFHSPLMDDAAHEFGRLVAEAPIRDPRIPVVANATGEPVRDADSVREAMGQQMTSPVLWTTCVGHMIADGISVFLEVGPGKVLTGLIRRTSSDAAAIAVGTLAQLDFVMQEVES
jgi:[acyl-carrier-protein] S-malonyltransferase